MTALFIVGSHERPIEGASAARENSEERLSRKRKSRWSPERLVEQPKILVPPVPTGRTY